MTFALNEVCATATKAARGAGYSWGLAEEAGFATRWLVGQGLDGCRALAGFLTGPVPLNLSGSLPQKGKAGWGSESKLLCPLHMGSALSDFAGDLTSHGENIGALAQPILIVPFLGSAAKDLDVSITATWASVQITTDGRSVSVTGAVEQLDAVVASEVNVRIAGQVREPLQKRDRASPALDDWQILLDLAARTYAPATEASRNLGAGPGDGDD